MIEIKEKSQCCGCGGCSQICPKGCIEMKYDKEGFLYPQVDKENCVNCGLCEKVCPIINGRERTESVKSCKVAYAKDDELRKKSSSGGIFSLLAREILSQKGVVFGVTYDDKWMVFHTEISSYTDIERFRGSKYLQSEMRDCFKRVKGYLDAGRKVLFTGTACQISGLKGYLGREYDCLYTVDVLCHGTPSPKLWKQYVEYREKRYDSKARNISFRQKSKGWNAFSMEIIFENGEIYQDIFPKDDYMRMFLSNICLRPSCYDCHFKELERDSDITIGDCWGIEKYMPEMSDDRGTSVVLIHSDKGEELYQKIAQDLVTKEADADKALPKTADSRKSVAPHKNRQKYLKLIEKEGIPFGKYMKLLKKPITYRVKRKLKKNIRRKKS